MHDLLKDNYKDRLLRIEALRESILGKKFNITCDSCTECHCCKDRIGVDTSEYEMDQIRPFIKQEHIDKAVLAKKAYHDNGMYDCPFLNQDGKCDVYEVRPLVCAAYLVVDGEVDDCIVPSSKSSGNKVLISMIDIGSIFEYSKNMDVVKWCFDDMKNRAKELLDIF